MSRRFTAIALALAFTAACGGDGTSGGKTVTVFAAASLTGTFTELGKRFEAEHPGVKVRFNFGSSATLAQQITQGAPADVFAAASPATMVKDASPVTFARNKLEIVVPAGNPAEVDELKDLADPKVKVALCAPQVPCGAAAVKALEGLAVRPVTREQDVKATLTKVTLGEVDAALVYKTDVLAAGAKVNGFPFPEADKAINDYPIATLTARGEQFVELVRSAQGKDVLVKAGFQVP